MKSETTPRKYLYQVEGSRKVKSDRTINELNFSAWKLSDKANDLIKKDPKLGELWNRGKIAEFLARAEKFLEEKS